MDAYWSVLPRWRCYPIHAFLFDLWVTPLSQAIHGPISKKLFSSHKEEMNNSIIVPNKASINFKTKIDQSELAYYATRGSPNKLCFMPFQKKKTMLYTLPSRICICHVKTFFLGGLAALGSISFWLLAKLRKSFSTFHARV